MVNETKKERAALILQLTNELTVLRAKIGISQEELSLRCGISRQTYSSIECGKRLMTWNTFLTLVLFFEHNPSTFQIIKNMDDFYDRVCVIMSYTSEKQIQQYNNLVRKNEID